MLIQIIFLLLVMNNTNSINSDLQSGSVFYIDSYTFSDPVVDAHEEFNVDEDNLAICEDCDEIATFFIVEYGEVVGLCRKCYLGE